MKYRLYCPGIVAGLMVLAFCHAARAADLVVVANSSVKASRVGPDDLRDVFLGEKNFLPDGSKVSPVLLKGGAAHGAFLKVYLGKSDATLRAGWRKVVFTGQGEMPKTFDSEAALLDYIAVTPGTIGYASGIGAHSNLKSITVK